MKSFFSAELAVFHELDSVRIVFLVLHRVVIPLLAFCACENDLISHGDPSLTI